MPRIIPIRDLKDTAKISEMVHESDEPIFVTKNGYGEMAIMSMKAYEEKMFMFDLYEKVAAAEKEFQEGKGRDAFESIKKIKEKHGMSTEE